jgi:hypothetical protein
MILLAPTGAAPVTTWNPADNSDLTLSNGNLTAAAQTSSSTWRGIRSTTNKSTGKWYWEATIGAVDGSNGWMIGAGNVSAPLTGNLGSDANSVGLQFGPGGTATFNLWYNGGSAVAATGNMATAGDVIGVAYDAGGNTIQGNNWTKGTGWLPAIAFSAPISGSKFIMFSGYFGGSADSAILNPGPAGFTGVPPSGFGAWA